MALQHVNRRGDVYYVLQGKTKTGKPKYYALKKNVGTPVESLPDEFEIFEQVDSAMVSIRKRKPSHMVPEERELLCDRIRQLTDVVNFRVDIDGDNLIVYVADQGLQDMMSEFAESYGMFASSRLKIVSARFSRDSAQLKFTLIDPSRRMFAASRFCCRGSFEGWITLEIGKPLDLLAKKYLPHLGQESFYDLVGGY